MRMTRDRYMSLCDRASARESASGLFVLIMKGLQSAFYRWGISKNG